MDRSQFWDRKILAWEASRYRNPAQFGPRVLRAFSASPIHLRRQLAAQILGKSARGRSILDLGCGSGLLFEVLRAEDHTALTGVDISGTGIAKGLSKRWPSNVRFEVSDVTRDPLPPSDCVVALGLLDWIDPVEIGELFERIGDRSFLVSFSERRAPAFRFIHRVLVSRAGLAKPALLPKYYSRDEMRSLIGRASGRIRFLTHPKLNFCTFVTNIEGAELFPPG